MSTFDKDLAKAIEASKKSFQEEQKKAKDLKNDADKPAPGHNYFIDPIIPEPLTAEDIEHAKKNAEWEEMVRNNPRGIFIPRPVQSKPDDGNLEKFPTIVNTKNKFKN